MDFDVSVPSNDPATAFSMPEEMLNEFYSYDDLQKILLEIDWGVEEDYKVAFFSISSDFIFSKYFVKNSHMLRKLSFVPCRRF
jgi:hypothetical protein